MQCDFGFAVCGVRGQVVIHPLWRHFCQVPRGLIHVVNSTDLNKHVDAEEELDSLVTDEIIDTVVLALANTLTPSFATLSDQKLCMNEDHCGTGRRRRRRERGGYACDEGKVHARAPSTGLAQADVRRDNGLGKSKMSGGGGIPPPAH